MLGSISEQFCQFRSLFVNFPREFQSLQIQIIELFLMTYRIEGETLITNQPSHPREERTQFRITSDGRLILLYGDDHSVYVRSEEQLVAPSAT